MTGGSFRKSTVGEASQSQDKKPIKATQKMILSTVMAERLDGEACSGAVMMTALKLVTAAQAHTNQGAKESQWYPNPAVKAASRNPAQHGTDVATECQTRAVTQ